MQNDMGLRSRPYILRATARAMKIAIGTLGKWYSDQQKPVSGVNLNAVVRTP